MTDANLVLGRLDPEYFLGGRCRARPRGAAAARSPSSPRSSGSTPEELACALAIADTADENMANAIRLIAVDRGLDPREFALIAFGGAGPLHAREVAARLGMTTVLVPPHPGLWLRLRRRDRDPALRWTRAWTLDSAALDLAVTSRGVRQRPIAGCHRGDGRRTASQRRRRRADHVAAHGRRCATPARTTSWRSACPPRISTEAAWERLLGRFDRRARAQLRLLAPRRADRVDQPAGDRLPGDELTARRRTARRPGRARRAGPARLCSPPTARSSCPVLPRGTSSSPGATHRAQRSSRRRTRPRWSGPRDRFTLLASGEYADRPERRSMA